MKVRYKKSHPLIAVDCPKIDEMYHVSWGKSHGVVGRVVSINEVNKTVIMVSPKTNLRWKNSVQWDCLRHTRKAQLRIESAALNTTKQQDNGQDR